MPPPLQVPVLSNSHEVARTVIYALGVLGTWAIAVLAIWGDKIKAVLLPPRVAIDLLSPIGERVEVEPVKPEFGGPGGAKFEARYYHIRLSNGARFSPAHGAQISITSIETQGPDGLPQRVFSGKIPLKWQYQFAGFGDVARTIGPDAVADFLVVTEKKDLRLTTMVAPSGFPGSSGKATTLWVTLQAHAVESNSRPLRLQVAWDGQWDRGDAEMARHLVIRRC